MSFLIKITDFLILSLIKIKDFWIYLSPPTTLEEPLLTYSEAQGILSGARDTPSRPIFDLEAPNPNQETRYSLLSPTTSKDLSAMNTKSRLNFEKKI
tara:strand:+ start:18271 stop:18561 length:291 start_codon:yes stop_codon:yes gene_type:complete